MERAIRGLMCLNCLSDVLLPTEWPQVLEMTEVCPGRRGQHNIIVAFWTRTDPHRCSLTQKNNNNNLQVSSTSSSHEYLQFKFISSSFLYSNLVSWLSRKAYSWQQTVQGNICVSRVSDSVILSLFWQFTRINSDDLSPMENISRENNRGYRQGLGLSCSRVKSVKFCIPFLWHKTVVVRRDNWELLLFCAPSPNFQLNLCGQTGHCIREGQVKDNISQNLTLLSPKQWCSSSYF